MAGKPKGIEDWAKVLKYVMKTGKGAKQGPAAVAGPKTRYQVSKAANAGVKSKPKSVVSAKPKPKPQRKARPANVGKIAAVAPERPPRAPSIRNRALPKTRAEMREAERQANRLLRRADGPRKPDSRPKGNEISPDVKGSMVTPPRKATVRPPKPAIESYEGDYYKGQIRADYNEFGGGKKRPRPKK
jgi:hypothetical protein